MFAVIKLLAATVQATAQAAKVQSTPMAEAAVPMSTLPKDHNPLSIKNRLRTRPNRFDGVSIWMAVLHNARTEIWKKPTIAKNRKDKIKI